MNGTVFYVGLGLGLACACGLRPFLPLLLAGAFGSAGTLSVTFATAGHEAFKFLQADWWLLVVVVTLALAYALQLLLGLTPVLDPRERSRRIDPLAAAVAGLGLGAGAVLFGGALAAHGDSPWPGLVGGVLAAGLAQRATWPVILRARARLPDRSAREALTVYLDAASLVLAALVAALHPLGYVAVVALAWFAWQGRSRAGGDRYAGLRILRR